MNSSGYYSDIVNEVYNPDNETINVNSVSSYKAITEPLTDSQCIWLKELIQSPKVFVKLVNGDFLPVQLTTVNYPVQQKKFSTTLLRVEIDFTGNGDVINSVYNEYGATNQLSFIDSQMNALSNNINGYNII